MTDDFPEDEVTKPYDLQELAEMGRQLGASLTEELPDVKLSIDLDAGTFEDIAALASLHGRTVTSEVRRLIVDHLNLDAMVRRALSAT